jgi:hypothetical protein
MLKHLAELFREFTESSSKTTAFKVYISVTHIHAPLLYAYTCVCMCVYIRICICMYVCAYVRVCVCVFKCSSFKDKLKNMETIYKK